MSSTKWDMCPKIAVHSATTRRRYFMSEADRDAEIGRAYARAKQIDAELRELAIAARRIGEIFRRIGGVLENNPEGLVFEKESSDGRFHLAYMIEERDHKDINVAALRALANSYRELLIEKERLDGLLR
jgi:hypothetical protein